MQYLNSRHPRKWRWYQKSNSKQNDMIWSKWISYTLLLARKQIQLMSFMRVWPSTGLVLEEQLAASTSKSEDFSACQAVPALWPMENYEEKVWGVRLHACTISWLWCTYVRPDCLHRWSCHSTRFRNSCQNSRMSSADRCVGSMMLVQEGMNLLFKPGDRSTE